MSKKPNKQKQKQPLIKKATKANGDEEYYIAKPIQKTIGGKVLIIILAGLMVLSVVGSLIVAMIGLMK